MLTADGARIPPSGAKSYSVGERATINCLSDGAPSPRYIWGRMAGGGFEEIRSGRNIQVADGTLRSVYIIHKVFVKEDWLY